MIVDHDENMRKLAFSRIMKARCSENANTRRIFRVPEINFDAQSYGDMICWKTEYVNDEEENENGDLKYFTSYTEPPLLSDLSEEALLVVVKDGELPNKI